jgi:hypothetical protein
MVMDYSIFSVHSCPLAALVSERSEACPHMQIMASCTENSGKTFGLGLLCERKTDQFSEWESVIVLLVSACSPSQRFSLGFSERFSLESSLERISHRPPCVSMPNYLHTPPPPPPPDPPLTQTQTNTHNQRERGSERERERGEEVGREGERQGGRQAQAGRKGEGERKIDR